jgi:hypothetical protein
MKTHTVGDLVTKHGSSEKEEPQFFYHSGLKKIYATSMKPHLDYAANVLSRWRAGLDVWPHAKRKKR